MSDEEAQARLDSYLGHMLEAAQLARQYVQGVSKDEFLTDRRTQQAVVLNLMTIGEAAARIVNECKEFAAAHPEIPWSQMRGMRNRMVALPHATLLLVGRVGASHCWPAPTRPMRGRSLAQVAGVSA